VTTRPLRRTPHIEELVGLGILIVYRIACVVGFRIRASWLMGKWAGVLIVNGSGILRE